MIKVDNLYKVYSYKKKEMVNITVRRSRQSGVARATCPD
jgi:hypothetical protein